jgi:hypothetical protein
MYYLPEHCGQTALKDWHMTRAPYYLRAIYVFIGLQVRAQVFDFLDVSNQHSRVRFYP